MQIYTFAWHHSTGLYKVTNTSFRVSQYSKLSNDGGIDPHFWFNWQLRGVISV